MESREAGGPQGMHRQPENTVSMLDSNCKFIVLRNEHLRVCLIYCGLIKIGFTQEYQTVTCTDANDHKGPKLQTNMEKQDSMQQYLT